MHKLALVALSLVLLSCRQASPTRTDAGTSTDAAASYHRVIPVEPVEPPRPNVPHKPIPPHPLVKRCMDQEKGDWEHLKGCLTAVAAEASRPRPDAGAHVVGAEAPFPPVNNPSWLIPEWDYDNASRLATCSDSNTCVDSAHPCCTRQQVVSRWGTVEPIFRQNTVEKAHSSWPRNPVVDQFDVRVHVQNGAQYSFQCDLVQQATGTLASVVSKNRATPQRLNVTLAAGLTVPTLVFDSSRSSYSWITFNTAGNAWDMTEPLIENHVAPPDTPPTPDDGWTTGDSYTAYTELYLPLRHWATSWEDLVDSPDSRPTLANCAVGQGLTAGSDQAMVRFDVMGDALLNVSFLNASSVVQLAYTHGSRAGSSIINPYGCSSGNAGVTACADGNAARIVFSGNNIGGITVDKQMQLYGGSVYTAFMANVELRGDIDLEGLNLTGTSGYGDIYLGNSTSLALNGGSLVPDPSVGSAHIWGPGGFAVSNQGTLAYLDPPCTSLLAFGSLTSIDNAFTASACDFTHNLEMCVPGLQASTGISTLCNLLNTSIAAGGYGGTLRGPFGSILTDNLRRNDTTTPYFLFDGGIVGVGCGPGQSCTLTSNITSSTVTAGTGIVVSGGPNYTVSLSNPVAVVNGGTSDTSLTAHNVLLGEGTSAVAFAAPSSGALALVSNGAASDPSFQALPVAGLSAGGTSGMILTSHGSTPEWDTMGGDVQFLSYSGTVHTNQILNLQGVSVTLASLTNNDVLTYNSTGPKWQNKQPGTPSSITSSVNHGSSTALTQGTYATLATVTMTIVGTVVDCHISVEWDPLGQTGGATFQYGISQDSTTSPSAIRNLSEGQSNSVGGALVESYTGVSAGSHTYRLLAETTTTCPGCTSNTARGDILCLQH